MTHSLDKENMEQVILDSPQQYLDGLKAVDDIRVQPLNSLTLNRVLVAGMGGSWMAAALLRDSGLISAPLNIHRSYDLPSWADDKTLVIASSYSGNTEETLSAYHAAKEKNLPLIGIAAGGELEKICAADNIPFIKIPANPPTIQPRCATGYSVGIMAGIFEHLGLAENGSMKQIKRLSEFLSGFMAEARNRGEALVPEFKTSTPIIYSDDQFKSVARIWKIKCNENAKTPAFWNFFPELNHNEMVGWTLPHGQFRAIFLKDPGSHERNLKRMEITVKLLEEKRIKSSVIQMAGSIKLEKVFSTLLTGDWFSWRLALELGINPSPVDMVEEFKKLLK